MNISVSAFGFMSELEKKNTPVGGNRNRKTQTWLVLAALFKTFFYPDETSNLNPQFCIFLGLKLQNAPFFLGFVLEFFK